MSAPHPVLVALDEKLTTIEGRDRCSPDCSPGCAGCSPDGFWAAVVGDQLSETRAALESVLARAILVEDEQARQIRGTHHYAFRSGAWATIVAVGAAPVETKEGVLLRECYLVRFEDGIMDFLPVIDPDAGYEFRTMPA